MVVGYHREVATSIVRTELKLIFLLLLSSSSSYLVRLGAIQIWSILTKNILLPKFSIIQWYKILRGLAVVFKLLGYVLTEGETWPS